MFFLFHNFFLKRTTTYNFKFNIASVLLLQMRHLNKSSFFMKNTIAKTIFSAIFLTKKTIEQRSGNITRNKEKHHSRQNYFVQTFNLKGIILCARLSQLTTIMCKSWLKKSKAFKNLPTRNNKCYFCISHTCKSLLVNIRT